MTNVACFRGQYFSCLKSGLYIAVRIAEHACDDASKRILKLSEYGLKKLPVKYQNLRSFQRQGEQAVSVHLKIHVPSHVFPILGTYMETRLKEGI